MTTDSWPLAAVHAQDAADFDALFLAHYGGVYGLLYRIVGTREEAEDLAQETFLRLARQRFTADRQHNVRGWLYRVATNLAYNALRAQRRRQQRETVSMGYDSDASDATADPALEAERAAERAAVRQTLARLPQRQMQLLLLRHAGLSYRELADALEIAPGSVGTLLARAEAAFERAYRATCGEKESET